VSVSGGIALYVFDDRVADAWAPFALTRPGSELRFGRWSLRERLEQFAGVRAAGLFKKARDGVRLLANGDLKAKVNITVAGASKAAVAAVEKAGGSVTIAAPKAEAGEAGASKAKAKPKAKETQAKGEGGADAEA